MTYRLPLIQNNGVFQELASSDELILTNVGIYNSSALYFYTDAGATQKGYIGQYTTGSDLTLNSTGTSNWLRLGSKSLIGFWMNGNADVDNAPQITFRPTGVITANGLTLSNLSSPQ